MKGALAPSSSRLAEDRLSILLLDYEMAREDERSFYSIQAAVIGVAVALVAGLSALLTRSCALQGGPGSANAEQCTRVPEEILVAAPLAPFALVTFVLLLGLSATIRSYYLRSLETEMQEYAGAQFKALPGVRPGTYTELMSEMTSLRRGKTGYPVLVLLISLVALLIFGGFVVYIFLGVESLPRIAMVVIYGPATLFVLYAALRATVGGRGLFENIVGAYVERMRMGRRSTVPAVPREPRKERTLVSYLILPRPEEIPKALIAPLAFALTGLAVGGLAGPEIARAIAVWIVLEYLIYEARYQWNDARGLHEDYAHRDRESRARLPLGNKAPASTIFNLRASLLVAALRLLVALAVGVVIGLGPTVLALLIAVFALAVPYEALRSRAAEEDLAESRRRRLSRAIWVVVGGGYLIRGVAGMCLAGLALGSAATAIGALAFAAYGVMFVTLTWALEGLAHSVRNGDGSFDTLSDRTPKLHLTMLRDYMDVPAPPYPVPPKAQRNGGSGATTESTDLIYAKGLERAGAYRAPWNLAFFCCAGFGGMLGAVLASDAELNAWVPVAGLVALAGALTLAALPARWRLPAALAVAIGLAAIGHELGGWGPLLVAAPWLSFAGLYVSFRDSSYYSLKHWLPDLRGGFERATMALAVPLVGRKTVESLARAAQRGPPS